MATTENKSLLLEGGETLYDVANDYTLLVRARNIECFADTTARTSRWKRAYSNPDLVIGYTDGEVHWAVGPAGFEGGKL